MPVKGGAKLKAFIRRAKAAQATGARKLEVGFYADAKYQDGTPVTNVAAWNEFGHRGGGGFGPTPERPFFRNSLRDADKLWLPIMKREIDPATMVVTPTTAGRMGEEMKSRIQGEITDLKDPPNSPTTLAMKAPKTNPLVVSGFMKASVSYRVE